ncbi:MAG: GNAT family N-acetyltransferase [Verrucomicrobia bacterium]|nr:GNAT family N-acetyltransferase [Verrucomicrobiota bacterium]
MTANTPSQLHVKIHPLTPERWRDFEALFGKSGACAGCWCMWWRLPRAQWTKQKGAGNKTAIRAIVKAGEFPGLLAFVGDQPVGWCALAPRVVYPRLATSRTLKPIDDEPVWSITCFFVARPYRRRGVTVQLLKAAVDFARRNGAKLVEGYPVEPKKVQPDVFVYTGLASAFRKAGFKEVVRRSPSRPIMRCVLSTVGTQRPQ